MSNMTTSQKEKRRAEALGITVSAYKKLRGRSSVQRRARKAAELGVSGQSLRKTGVDKLSLADKWKRTTSLESDKFSNSETLLHFLSVPTESSASFFGRMMNGRKNNEKVAKTSLGKDLESVHYRNSDWSKKCLADRDLGSFETDYADKIGPRSTYDCETFKKNLLTWGDTLPVDTAIINEASLRVASQFSTVDRWDIKQLPTILEKIDRHKGAGYPWIAKKPITMTKEERGKYDLDPIEVKYKDKSEEEVIRLLDRRDKLLKDYPSAVNKVFGRLNAISQGQIPEVINIQGLRTDSVSHDEEEEAPLAKPRLIWMAPFDHLIVEGLLSSNFSSSIMSGEQEFTRHYWAGLESKTNVKNSGYDTLMRLITVAKKWNKPCYSIDFSAFDQHITRDVMRVPLNILKDKAHLTKNESAYLEYSVLRSPLWTPWGEMNRDNGIPSGSTFTNLFDSIINATFCEAISIKYNCEVEYLVNGDDCALVVNSDISVEDLSEMATHFGMELNPAKQWIHPHSFTFNRSIWAHKYACGVPFMHRVYNQMLYYDTQREPKHGTAELSAIYNQLNNLKCHPYRNEFLDWLVKTIKDKTKVNRLNPNLYDSDTMLPPIEAYSKMEEGEDDYRSIMYYKHSWFWNVLCDTI